LERKTSTPGGGGGVREVLVDSCCIVCFDAPQDTVMVPCGHVPACWSCSLQIFDGKAGGTAASRGIALCPLCRARVTAVIKLYRV